jgi:hypothetical protein
MKARAERRPAAPGGVEARQQLKGRQGRRQLSLAEIISMQQEQPSNGVRPSSRSWGISWAESPGERSTSGFQAFALFDPAFLFENYLTHLLAAQSKLVANSFKSDAFRPASANGLIALDVLRARAAPAIWQVGRLCTAFALRHG